MKKIFILSILFIFLFFSCNNSSYFSEYSGNNLISTIDFTSASWIKNAISESEAVAAAGAGESYMDFSAIVDGTYSDASRLEILNLVVDGDFDAGSAAWTSSDGGTTAIIDDISSGQLDYTTTNASEYIYYNLPALAAVSNATYSVNFDCINTGASTYLYFAYNTTIAAVPTNVTEWTVEAGTTILEDYRDNSSGAPIVTCDTSPQFRIGSFGGAQEGSIDNIRISRTDLENRMELAIAYSDLALNLISGTYTFSVYVRTDDNAGNNNIFDAQNIELGIISYNGTTQASQKIKVHNYSSVGWDSWTKVSVTDAIETYDNNTDPCLMLYISPTSLSNEADSEPGSIYISNPSLTLNP